MLPEVNLLPKYERSESILYRIFIIGFIFIILASGVLGYFYFSAKGHLNTAEESITALNEEKAVLETRLHAVNTEEKVSLKEVVAYLESYHIPTSMLIDELVTLLPAHADLSQFSYDYHSIDIETQFETIPDTSAYIANLIESAYLDEVVINRIEAILQGESENILGYHADYSMQINHQNLAGEEEN